MTLDNPTELANTRAKLRELQERYETLRADTSEDPRVRLTMLSLKRLINQLTEDITRFEARAHRA